MEPVGVPVKLTCISIRQVFFNTNERRIEKCDCTPDDLGCKGYFIKVLVLSNMTTASDPKRTSRFSAPSIKKQNSDHGVAKDLSNTQFTSTLPGFRRTVVVDDLPQAQAFQPPPPELASQYNRKAENPYDPKVKLKNQIHLKKQLRQGGVQGTITRLSANPDQFFSTTSEMDGFFSRLAPQQRAMLSSYWDEARTKLANTTEKLFKQFQNTSAPPKPTVSTVTSTVSEVKSASSQSAKQRKRARQKQKKKLKKAETTQKPTA